MLSIVYERLQERGKSKLVSWILPSATGKKVLPFTKVNKMDQANFGGVLSVLV